MAALTENQLTALRPYLFKIAYQMTGEVEEAEDIVQDVFARWLQRETAEVQNVKAYLARMTVHTSINRLNELKAARELYTGPWLPEPYITTTPDHDTPDIEYGLLFLLERLNAMERAVFILRESFGEDYDTIATFTGLKAENCRQLLHRSREKLKAGSVKPADKEKLKALTEAFLFALHSQNREALETMLKHDIVLYSDGGGKRAAALKPIAGLDKVLKFLFGVQNMEENKTDVLTYRPSFFNGFPGALIYRESTGEVDSAITLRFDEDGVSELLFIRNPDKLRVGK
ncbi:MAG: RNA polymerase subunit sigma-24 [Bacteroidia bacterium]|nr:RNA polymerase subunit sigma-24 [Bacteroidia bacterium]